MNLVKLSVVVLGIVAVLFTASLFVANDAVAATQSQTNGTVFYIMVVGNETKVFVTSDDIDLFNTSGKNSYVMVDDIASIPTRGTGSTPRELTGAAKAQALAGWSGAMAEPYTGPARGGRSAFNSNSPVTPENAGAGKKSASPI